MAIKKNSKFFLVIGIISLFLFWGESISAIAPPSGLSPCPGEDVPLIVPLEWSDVSAIDHYELYYKKSTDTHWTDRYPSVSEYTIAGLAPDSSYEWYVVSCGDADCSDSAFSQTCFFTTEEFTPPNGGNGNGNGNGTPIGIQNPLTADTLEEAINRFINFLFYLAIAVVPILIIYAGFLILTSHGDSKQLSKAKTMILWTLVAFAIILFAKGLPSVVKGVMGG